MRMLRPLSRPWLRFGRAWQPLHFSDPGFAKTIPCNQKIEEETIPDYIASRYYPVRIGEVLRNQYQIIGKLGFGVSSTAWLARDMNYRRYVMIKVSINSSALGRHLEDEVDMYRRMDKASKTHPGRKAVRSLLDLFDIDGPEDKHRCLVHPPLWESVSTFLRRNPINRLPKPVLAFVLQRLFLALDYLHTECQIIHADIKADNIMFGIADDSVFHEFEKEELHNPTPRKQLDGRSIYMSRELNMPKELAAPVLCDFGSAMSGDVEHCEDIQPDIYRAPEVILEAPWTYSADIWNVGCMVWDLFEDETLFSGYDQEFQTYRSRAHLAEMTYLLGSPPTSLLAQGKSSAKFFSQQGQLLAKNTSQTRIPLEAGERFLEGQDKAMFLQFMHKMLQWDPSGRASARQLVEDEWICRNL